MLAKKMKALIMTEQGGPEVLRTAEVDKPEIKKISTESLRLMALERLIEPWKAGETLGRVGLKIDQE
jgi:hypothetical protein